MTCACGNARFGRYTRDQCAACWVALHRGRGSDLAGAPPDAPPPCRHLGLPLTPPQLAKLGLEVSTCGCAGKVRECDEFKVCTTGTSKLGVACCLGCPAFDPARPPG